MSSSLFIIQILNGLQLGIVLFLVAAGLTLVFGVMDFINLAHGVQYMVGAYLAALVGVHVGSVWLGLAAAILGGFALGLLLEALLFKHLMRRSHLEQVLATFGVILILTDLARLLFGAAPLPSAPPEALSGSVMIAPGLAYPVWRLAVITAGLGVALLLWALVTRTRAGMLTRAGATHPHIVSALGVDIEALFLKVFAFGAMLAGFAGAMAGPLVSVEPTMGDNVLILAFVVIVIGGIGSIRGALLGALAVGLVDTLGRAFITDLLRLMLPRPTAAAAGPALASMMVYVLMAAVLAVKPSGLFGGRE